MIRFVCLALLVACSGGSSDPTGDADDTGSTDTGTPSTSDTSPAPAADYSQWGPWSVGTEEGTVVGTEGSLKAQFWFPSDDAQGAGERYDGLLQGVATQGLTPSCDAPRPVMVFSHGLGGVRWQSPFFVEHLASHGFFVVAVDHTGSTLSDTDWTQLGAVALRRPLDVAAAFDGAAEQFPDCVDPDAGYAVSGHSFGGYTAFAVAGAELNHPEIRNQTLTRGDDRVWAAIALAPWDGYGVITDGTRLIDIPTMVLTGRQDATTPLTMVEGLWAPLEVSPRYFGVLDPAGHYTFSPVACLLESGDGCGPGFLSEAESDPLIQQASAAFLFAELGVPDADLQIEVEAEAYTWESAR